MSGKGVIHEYGETMTIYTVTDLDGLYDALAKASGGDEVRLAAGDYGKFELNHKSGFDTTFDAPVTITSADPDAPASFSGMNLNGISNITIDNVVFDYTYSEGDQNWTTPFLVQNSDNFTIKNSVFDGDKPEGLSEFEDGYGFGKALVIRETDNLVLDNNELKDWYKGISVARSANVEVTNNDVHSMRSDGINFAEVQNVLVEGNYIHDFDISEGAGDHADMIQFWTNGTDAPSTDIIIRGNILDIGEGDNTQSIFMRNEEVDRGNAGTEMFYQNVLIEDNVIRNGHSHGISVGETDGLIIRNNTVLSIEETDPRFFRAPEIKVAADSTDVTVMYNAVADIDGYENTNQFNVSKNAYIQNSDPNAVGYYSDLFLESSLNGPLQDFVATPGGMIANLGAGAASHVFDATPAELAPHFDVLSSADTADTLVFDASYTFGPAGQVGSEDATFTWDFGDGTIGEGRSGAHTYAEPGHYQVSLTVTTDGGKVTKVVTADVGIAGGDLLSFDSVSGSFDAEAYGDSTAIAETSVASVQKSGKMAVDLGGDGTAVKISQDHFSKFFGTDGFEISMQLQSDYAGAGTGEIFRIHQNLIASVNADGAVTVRMFTDADETIDLIASGVKINDGQLHNVSIQFDGDADTLQILINGQVIASAAVAGDIAADAPRSLYFGNPWGGDNFEGTLSAFDLRANTVDYPLATDSLGAFEVVEQPDVTPPDSEDQTDSTEDTSDPDVPDTDTSDPGPDNSDDNSNGGSDGASNGGASDDDTAPEETDEPAPDTDQEAAVPAYDDFILNFAEVTDEQLRGGASVRQDGAGTFIKLDSSRDYVNLGHIEELDNTDELSLSVSFRKSNADDSNMRLVWKHTELGVIVTEDGLQIRADQADSPFYKGITIKDLGLNDTELHTVSLVLDSDQDRLQVVLDGQVVHDETGVRDFEVGDEGDAQWGWHLGSAWGGDFYGEIHEFSMEAEALFVDDPSLIA